ncbi:MAG: hypothetical protein NWE95_11370 [Candidatus Bathyarchaeota archaeon]|nr:hypothetical protein [Candidatus Bathyarchaeota archaeon]
MPTLERTVSLNIDEAYTKLKDNFTAKGYKILSEEPTKQIKFSQGSLWGIAPRTAKKKVIINLEAQGSQTKLSASSNLASDWKNITIIGCILAVALASLCVWMANDLTAFMAERAPSFWSWIVTVEGDVNLQATQSLINLAWGLAVFLSVIVLLEIAIVGYAKNKLYVIAEETFNELEKSAK